MPTATDVPADTAEDLTEESTEPETVSERAKRVTRAHALDAWIKTRGDLKSTAFRNRKQLAPWGLPAGIGATGTLGALAAEHADHITPLAAAPATGAVALAGSWLALRHIRDYVPAKFLSRFQAGVAAGCAWCATLPLTGVENAGMWLTLGLGTVGLSARWWQHIRPGHPEQDSENEHEQESSEQESSEETIPDSDAELLEVWDRHVANKNGPLPGAVMTVPHRTLTNGRAYQVQLARGQQSLEEARNALTKIAGGLGTTATKLAFEPLLVDGDAVDDSLVELRIIDRSPVAGGMTYPGPQIVRDEHGGVHIELGPYSDGEDTAKFTVFEEDSMRSGLVVGTTGSGKSRLLELIAIGLRELGVEIWFLDPQEGQSSPALAQYADWYLPGLGDDERPTGHIDDLLAAMKGGMRYRSKKLGAQKQRGFTHSQQMPGVMVIIDEAKDVFNAETPSGATYGTIFGEYAKKFRKNGFGMLAVGHVIRLETVGGDKTLRSSLMGYNTIALKTSEASEKNMLPPGMPDPASLPQVPGYGFIASSASSRVASYRSYDPGEVEPWLAARPAEGTDRGTAHAAGDAYVRRVEIAQEKQRALEEELAAFERGEIDLDDDPEPAPAMAGSTAASSAMDLPSISGGQIHRPAAPDGVPSRALKPREQQLMALFDSYEELSVAQIAEELGISDRAVRTLIKGLGDTRLVKVSSGVYRRA